MKIKSVDANKNKLTVELDNNSSELSITSDQLCRLIEFYKSRIEEKYDPGELFIYGNSYDVKNYKQLDSMMTALEELDLGTVQINFDDCYNIMLKEFCDANIKDSSDPEIINSFETLAADFMKPGHDNENSNLEISESDGFDNSSFGTQVHEDEIPTISNREFQENQDVEDQLNKKGQHNSIEANFSSAYKVMGDLFKALEGEHQALTIFLAKLNEELSNKVEFPSSNNKNKRHCK